MKYSHTQWFFIVFKTAIMLSVLYLYVVNPLEKTGLTLPIASSIIAILFVISIIFTSYRFLREMFWCIAVLLAIGYYFFQTPSNEIILGVSLAVIVLVSCFAVYFWVRYKKIPPDTKS